MGFCCLVGRVAQCIFMLYPALHKLGSRPLIHFLQCIAHVESWCAANAAVRHYSPFAHRRLRSGVLDSGALPVLFGLFSNGVQSFVLDHLAYFRGPWPLSELGKVLMGPKGKVPKKGPKEGPQRKGPKRRGPYSLMDHQ